MAGETNLAEVLRGMMVTCDEIVYGFASVGNDCHVALAEVLGVFHEQEGLTVIASIDYLEARELHYEGKYAKLTIEVHTSLALVGLTAVIATKLAEFGISANVVAAFHHDHIFVPFDTRNMAMTALHSFREESS